MKINTFLFLNRIIYFSGLLFSVGVIAENNSPIVVYELETRDTFVQSSLGHEVYRYSTSPDLSDLAVQDSKGNKLPFRIIPAVSKSQTLETVTPAIFFPVAPGTGEDQLRTLSSSSVQINSDKVHVEIVAPTGSLAAIANSPEYYLIDLNQSNKASTSNSSLTLSGLELQLQEKSDSYHTWSLSGSNDLHQWYELSTKTLVNLHKEGHSLTQNTIPLALQSDDYAYFKLQCVGEGGANQLNVVGATVDICRNSQLSGINILQRSTQTHYPADTQWKLSGEKVSAKSVQLSVDDIWKASTAFEFFRDDVAPINKFSIVLGEQMYTDRIRLLGRNGHKRPWQLVYQGVWFNTKVGNQWFVSDEQYLYGQFTEFRLEMSHPVTIDPELVFYTETKLIQFVTNDSNQYQLVIGAIAQGEAQSGVLESVLRAQTPSWVNHQLNFLNPPKPERVSLVSWRTLIFWGVLVLSLVLLIFMATKLFRQMNAISK